MLSPKDVHTLDSLNSLLVTDPEDVIFRRRRATRLQVLTVTSPEMTKFGRNINDLKQGRRG